MTGVAPLSFKGGKITSLCLQQQDINKNQDRLNPGFVSTK
jgi:hypothetical protein